MRAFTISGTFQAEDIDDAFRVLAEHFAALAEDALADTVLQAPAHIDIHPAD